MQSGIVKVPARSKNYSIFDIPRTIMIENKL